MKTTILCGELYKGYFGDVSGYGFGTESMAAKDRVCLESWNGLPFIHCTDLAVLDGGFACRQLPEVSRYLRIKLEEEEEARKVAHYLPMYAFEIQRHALTCAGNMAYCHTPLVSRRWLHAALVAPCGWPPAFPGLLLRNLH